MTREAAIAILTEARLDETIGMGGYADSAAYKLANGDISAQTAGLSDEVREAIAAVGGDLDFDEIDR